MARIGDKIPSKTKCDLVVERIVSKLVHGDLKHGDRLPSEGALAEEFGISRVTIREAFKKLNMMGIVSIHQGDGTFIEEIKLDNLMSPLYSKLLLNETSIEKIYEARLWIEAGCASMAADAAPETALLALNETLLSMRTAMETNDNALFSTLDDQFHTQLCAASGNYVLNSTISVLRGITRVYLSHMMTGETMADSYAHHLRILTALRARDRDAAEAAMKLHIRGCKQAMLAAMEAQARRETTPPDR